LAQSAVTLIGLSLIARDVDVILLGLLSGCSVEAAVLAYHHFTVKRSG